MRRLRLHLKILVEPRLGVDAIVDAATRVYAQAGVAVHVATRVTLKQPDLEVVTVTRNCVPRGPLTQDQQKLFALAREIGSSEIAIFFVKETRRKVNGCAQHPPSLAAAVVAQHCTQWTMAHEIGHLLELDHVNSSRRLMCSTERIKGDPPELVDQEIKTILASRLVANP